MLPLSDAENRTTTVPYVNQTLIFVNIAAFIAEMTLLSERASVTKLSVNELTLVPLRFIAHFSPEQFGTIFSSMFMHADLEHIAGNLWYLWIFGDNVEDKMGHTNYLLFYLTCGSLGALTHILTHPLDTIGCIGASGAISGVLAAYLVLFPGVQVTTWIAWLWRPKLSAWLLIGFWFFFQMVSSYLETTSTGGGTAFFDHIGGFVWGILLLRICLKKNALSPDDEHLPMPFFISAALVVYGAAAIGFSMYRANTLPFIHEPKKIEQAKKRPVPARTVSPAAPTPKATARGGSATHTKKHHKVRTTGTKQEKQPGN